METKTGSLPIGFRQGGSAWQTTDIAALAAWAKASGFAAVDLGRFSPASVQALAAADLRLGSVDLLRFGEITHPDAGKRREVIAANVAHIANAAASGARVFFTIVGADPAKTRGENYRIAVEAFAPIAQAAVNAGATVAVEGYPGDAPHYALLCTSPETCRAFLRDIPRGISINYDPSHLIRLGIDHIRFLGEFLPHVAHVHGKDTELLAEAAYEFGLYQPSAFTPPHRFGAYAWRYTIPGRGQARWTDIFNMLKAAGYRGIVSVELEDENFNGTEAGEKAGLLQSLAFLSGA